MDWLIRQLFGAQALAHLGDKVRAMVAQYVLAHPELGEAAVGAWATTQADLYIAQVLVHFPGWAAAVLTSLLNAEIGGLIAQAYQAVTKT